VFAGLSSNLPSVGDIVDLQGEYSSSGGAIPGRSALDILDISSNYADADLTVVSSGNTLPPVVVLADSVQIHGGGATPAGEPYEGMLVSITPSTAYYVCGAIGTNLSRYMTLSTTGDATGCGAGNVLRYVGSRFMDLSTLSVTGSPNNVGDIVSRLDGVLRYQDRGSTGEFYDVHPRDAADLGYTDN